jgi:hypothetical protein
MTYDKPTSYCVKCLYPYYNLGGGKCSRPIGYNKTCNGGIRSAVGPDDWKDCEHCSKKGNVDGKRCEVCNGARYVCTRPMQ